MDYTYQFEAHLRDHRPSRLGQRLWWLPAAAGVGVVIADGVYLVATPSDQLSAALAVPLLFIGAFLFLLASAALSIADWTYPSEKRYREAQHAAARQARAYILAGRRSRGEHPTVQPPEPQTASGVREESADPRSSAHGRGRANRELATPAAGASPAAGRS